MNSWQREEANKAYENLQSILAFYCNLSACRVSFAFLVSREPFGYVASMTYFILLIFLIIPISVAFLIAALVAGIKNNATYAGALLLSCLLLPLGSFGSLRLFEVVGLAEYTRPEYNEMRPIGSELKHRIVFVFDTKATQEEIRIFDETVLRKTLPQPNGVLLEFADGVCNFSYPETQSKQQS